MGFCVEPIPSGLNSLIQFWGDAAQLQTGRLTHMHLQLGCASIKDGLRQPKRQQQSASRDIANAWCEA
jgi:hypothetical protein